MYLLFMFLQTLINESKLNEFAHLFVAIRNIEGQHIIIN